MCRETDVGAGARHHCQPRIRHCQVSGSLGPVGWWCVPHSIPSTLPLLSKKKKSSLKLQRMEGREICLVGT